MMIKNFGVNLLLPERALNSFGNHILKGGGCLFIAFPVSLSTFLSLQAHLTTAVSATL